MKQVLNEKKSLSDCLIRRLEDPYELAVPVAVADSLCERLRHFDAHGYADLIETAEAFRLPQLPGKELSPRMAVDQALCQLQQICESFTTGVETDGGATEGLEYLRAEAVRIEDLVIQILQCDESTPLHDPLYEKD